MDRIRQIRISSIVALLLTLAMSASAGAQERGAGERPDYPIDPRRITETTLDPKEVERTVRRVADDALRTWDYPWRHWAMGPLYEGLLDASVVTGDPRYLAAVVRAGDTIQWQPGPSLYHADDMASTHTWLRIYLMNPADRPAQLEPIRNRIDEILANPIEEELSFTEDPRTPGVEQTDRWTWSDALYMAVPALGLLTEATGDRRYLHFVDRELRATYDALFDEEENLFYRDSRFIDQRTPNGEKVFWSRGNGWVFAGLPLLLDSMPPHYPNRDFYVDIFQRMATAVLRTQQPDGFWYQSLLDPEHVPMPEVSGSALFVFGLAWGVGQGLLDQDTFWPAVERGWQALTTRIGPDGAVTSVQPIGAKPEPHDEDSQASYGHGIVLSAGAEILQALDAAAEVDPAELLATASRMTASAPNLSSQHPSRVASAAGAADRAYNVRTLVRIASPVLEALSKGELHRRLPIHDWEKDRAAWTHYEAFARTLAGIAPWLELGPDDTDEGQIRARFIELSRQSLINATDPNSPDYMNFGQVPDQPLVESAYLAYALITAREQLWEPLSDEQKENVLAALRMGRTIELTHFNNWVLFPAMIEAALYHLGADGRPGPIVHAVTTMDSWYLGDGVYGDGPNLKWDYYNSYAIHPMMLMVLEVAQAQGLAIAERLPVAQQRALRYAEILERMVSPEATFPVMGRSSTYRFAAFFHLSDMARKGQLPDDVDPGAARAAITSVMRNMMQAPGTFDEEGWLRLGAVGYQPGLQEVYNATGSLYICLTALVHLGLPPDDPYWTAPYADWTQRQIWSGQDVPRDEALQGAR